MNECYKYKKARDNNIDDGDPNKFNKNKKEKRHNVNIQYKTNC